MDEQELAERLRKNPNLRIVGDTSNTRNTNNDNNACNTNNVDIDAAEAMLEAELQDHVRRTALANGWLYYHTYRSKRSEPGFPDTVLLKVGLKGWLYFVECKRESEKPTDEQKAWLAALHSFRILAKNFTGMDIDVAGFVWRPSDWLSGKIAATLSAL
jgi:hypothetical protein